jgi:DNA ligase (NAD+)
LAAWEQRTARLAEVALPLALTVEAKIDGMSVGVTYENGRLIRAVTRGDGLKGEDITAQVRASGAVPVFAELPTTPGMVTLPPVWLNHRS